MIQVKRVQTGVRIEASLLKVLKGVAAYKELGLGDLIEGICLHALEGKSPFTPETIAQIGQLRQVYGLKLSAGDSHQLVESPSRPRADRLPRSPKIGQRRRRSK